MRVNKEGVKVVQQEECYRNIYIVPSKIFSRDKNKVVSFINVCHLYIQLKLRQKMKEVKISWVLLYMQGEVVEV